MPSPIVKRSIVISGNKTSVSLEEPFWLDLKAIAAERGTTISDLVSSIDKGRQLGNLSSAIRLFVLEHHLARRARSRSQEEREQLEDPAHAQ
jgi:predicted DNA-binding ribbon-helix-helix protein